MITRFSPSAGTPLHLAHLSMQPKKLGIGKPASMQREKIGAGTPRQAPTMLGGR